MKNFWKKVLAFFAGIFKREVDRLFPAPGDVALPEDPDDIEPEVEPVEPPPEPYNGSCAVPPNPEDKGGSDHSTIWKAVANNKKLCILTGCQFAFVKVTVAGIAGKDHGRGNGNRQHWRWNKAGGRFPDQARVVALDEDGSVYAAVTKKSKNYQKLQWKKDK